MRSIRAIAPPLLRGSRELTLPAEPAGVRRRDRSGRRAEAAVADGVAPGGPAHGELAYDAAGVDGHRNLDRRRGVGALVVRDVPERQHTDRLALLEAQLAGDQPGGDRAGVDGRPVGEPLRAEPGNAVGDPAQRLPAHVLTHGGQVLRRRRAAVGIDALGWAKLDPTVSARVGRV